MSDKKMMKQLQVNENLGINGSHQKPKTYSSDDENKHKSSSSSHRLISVTESLRNLVNDDDENNNSDNGGIFKDVLYLPKRPGWRCPSSRLNDSKMIQDKFRDSMPLTEKLASDLIKSDTSISSSGPLKEFILIHKPMICHQAKIKFKLDPKLACEAEKTAEVLARQAIRESSLTSINEKTTGNCKQIQSNEHHHSSLPSLQRVKVFAIKEKMDEMVLIAGQKSDSNHSNLNKSEQPQEGHK